MGYVHRFMDLAMIYALAHIVTAVRASGGMIGFLSGIKPMQNEDKKEPKC